MTDSESENSACTWHLGVCIDDPEDIAAFDEHMRNVVITPEMVKMIKDLKRAQFLGNI